MTKAEAMKIIADDLHELTHRELASMLTDVMTKDELIDWIIDNMTDEQILECAEETLEGQQTSPLGMTSEQLKAFAKDVKKMKEE